MSSKIMREGERYMARLDKTMADGKVTTKEVDALVKDAHNGHFSEVEAFYLSAFADRTPRKFDPAARAKLLAFVQGEMHALAKIAGDDGDERRKAQPKLTADGAKTGRVTYDKVPGQVSVNGFNADDPLQGQVGDCYFISALAAVAKTDPQLLANAVRTNRDGTYTVTFHERGPKDSKPKPVEVTIDGSFANQHGRLEYAAARETKELWPQIFEKAYAQWRGGYDAIEGGMGATALEALTGQKTDFLPVTSASNPAETFKRISDAVKSGGAVVACSKSWEPGVQGIVADHAYTLLGVSEKNGQKLVQLRNPWGEKEPGVDGKDDGIFELPIEKFLTAYAAVEFTTK